VQRKPELRVGESIMQLDTPALVVDVGAYRANAKRVRNFLDRRRIKLLSDVSVHACPALAHYEQGALAGRQAIAVSTLGEATVFVEAGFRDVLIRNHVTQAHPMQRLATLARFAVVSTTVDTLENAEGLSDAARTAGTTIPVLVHVRLERAWCGVDSGSPAASLAAAISRLPGLAFGGLTGRVSYQSGSDTTHSQVRSAASRLALTRHSLARFHLKVPRVVLDMNGPYNALSHAEGITEVVLGKYGLMDANCARCCPDLRFAAKVLSTITSRPTPSRAILDAGQKALSSDRGLPIVDGYPDASAVRLGAEHCRLDLGPESAADLSIGRKVWLVPADIGVTTTLYDYICASSEGRLLSVWAAAARGHFS
jgi:3-hydroxy-D-aspartate aldolase